MSSQPRLHTDTLVSANYVQCYSIMITGVSKLITGFIAVMQYLLFQPLPELSEREVAALRAPLILH